VKVKTKSSKLILCTLCACATPPKPKVKHVSLGVYTSDGLSSAFSPV